MPANGDGKREEGLEPLLQCAATRGNSVAASNGEFTREWKVADASLRSAFQLRQPRCAEIDHIAKPLGHLPRDAPHSPLCPRNFNYVRGEHRAANAFHSPRPRDTDAQPRWQVASVGRVRRRCCCHGPVVALRLRAQYLARYLEVVTRGRSIAVTFGGLVFVFLFSSLLLFFSPQNLRSKDELYSDDGVRDARGGVHHTRRHPWCKRREHVNGGESRPWCR